MEGNTIYAVDVSMGGVGFVNGMSFAENRNDCPVIFQLGENGIELGVGDETPIPPDIDLSTVNVYGDPERLTPCHFPMGRSRI